MSKHSWIQAGYKVLHCKKCGCVKTAKSEYGRHYTEYEYKNVVTRIAPDCSERFVAKQILLFDNSQRNCNGYVSEYSS